MFTPGTPSRFRPDGSLDDLDRQSVGVAALNRASAGIRNLRSEARRVRKEAAILAEAKRRSPEIFTEARIAADLADAEREAVALERRADEIEVGSLSGMLSRPADVVRAEIEARRRDLDTSDFLPLGAMPPRPTKRRPPADPTPADPTETPDH